MISQGASLLNLSFVVAEADLRRAVEALHEDSSPSSIRRSSSATRRCMPERVAWRSSATAKWAG